jgi:hypothetical protein
VALGAESKQSNVETSLTVWLRAQLVTTAGLTVFIGMDVATTRPAQWVQLDYLLGLRTDYGRQVGQRLGGQSHGLLQTSLCLKRASITDVYAMARLHDTVATYLQEGQAIPLKDYATVGTPTIGYIELGATTQADVDTGLESGVVVRVLSTALVHSTAWSLA